MKRATLFAGEGQETSVEETFDETEVEQGFEVLLYGLPKELVSMYLPKYPKGSRAMPDCLNDGYMMIVKDIKKG